MKTKHILPLLSLFLFIGCDNDNNRAINQPEETETGLSLEAIEPEDTTVVSLEEIGLPIEAFEHTEDAYLYQGDILIPKDQPEAKVYERHELENLPPRRATARTSGLWPNNTLYYQINPNLSSTLKLRIDGAISWFDKNSNITFIEEPHTSGYVYFTTGSGCSSYVGKIGGRQNLTVGSNCSTGNIKHEILHALGFWHEQSRADRDNHVNILWENVRPGYEHNFRTYTEMRSDGQDFGNELDFSSIMMYPANSFSRNGKPTIVKADGTTYRTQRSNPSAQDKEALNKIYPIKSVEPEYENGVTYKIYGVWVLRHNDKWMWYSRANGWREVNMRGSYWYFTQTI